ncbi:MAG: T9SS type A sorting domain-containing protein [Bacteroidota bacterium]
MKTNRLLTGLLTLGLATAVNAQWDSLARFNQGIADIKTYNNSLFIAGDFLKMNGSTCYWSASYDGTSFTPQTNLIGGSGINMLAVFGSDLYCADALNYGGVTGVGIWTGSTWQDGGGTSYSHGLIYADGNDLYAGSNFGVVRKKTGTGSFSLFYDFAGSGGIASFARYNGKLVASGSFTAIGGVVAKNIAAWDGTTWTPLGTGLSTGAGSMAVYNNELYVAGKIATAGGVSVNNIAKWNGTTWSAVGGGTGTSPNGIMDMKASATGLIVVGDFTQMGGVTTSNVAVWNGTQWLGTGLTHIDAFVSSVEVFNNKIYVGTYDVNHSHLYRYNGTAGVGVNELKLNESNVSVYPNPATDQLTVDIAASTTGATVSVKNTMGQEVIAQNMSGSFQQLDISKLARGVYMITIQHEGSIVVKKFIKE